MTESDNEKRPVRKLTVKNFSVIKDAELEFGKITVLIGPQASGKSLLCKLAFFLGQVLPEIIDQSVMSNLPLGALEHKIHEEFEARFPESSWSKQEFEVRYTAGDFKVLVERFDRNQPPHFDFGTQFDNEYSNWLKVGPGDIRVVVPSRIRKQLETQGVALSNPPITEDSIYIPTGRSFYSTPSRGFVALSTKNLDWVTQRYSTVFDPDYKALRESYETERPLLSRFGNMTTQIVKGRVISEAGRLVFESANDLRRRPFEILSSGTLELLPLMGALSQVAKDARYPDIPTMPVPPFGVIYIEEPELSVFPSTQNDVIRLLAWLAGEASLWMSYVITTHSPYILSSFNNLIEAGQAARNNPELHDEVAKIIPEQYWIKEGDFKAYCIEDGTLRSILNESGFIEGNYLDRVSEVIGDEFDQLLRLEYDHTKAS